MRNVILVFCAMLILASCNKNKTGEISGTVSYLQRIALPADAVLSVRLEDVSKADAAALVIAETTRATNGAQVPLAYRLTYSTADIVSGARYQLRATISSQDGKALFTTTQAHPIVPEEGGIEMGILLQPVPPITQTLENTEWELVAIGEMLLAAHDGDSSAYLIVQRDGRIAGSTGCNRFFGVYTLKGEQLSFGGIGMTKMACVEPLMVQEQNFAAALDRVTGYRMSGRVLELLSGESAVMRFEARTKS